MEIVLAAVGRLRPSLRAAADDYRLRLQRYLRVSEREVREASRQPTLSAQRAEEARRLRGVLPPRAVVVALTRAGAGWTSAELAGVLARWQRDARPVALLLGGSEGLDPGLLAEAGQRWSLGPLTLPHELARVVVYEQLYRACSILRGEPYHKGAGP